MRSTAHFPRLSISYERKELAVEAMSPSKVPDPDWRFVDDQGHGHFWDGKKLPTLVWWVTGTSWVGDEYDGSEITEGEWRCKDCGATVEPGQKLEYGPSSIPGPATVQLQIENESYVFTPEKYAEAIEDWRKVLKQKYGRYLCDITFSAR